MAKPLDNAKHERFAQGLAKGLSAFQAYIEAGYSENRGNAIRLKAKESVAARVAEIQASAAEKAALTRSWVMRRLAENEREAAASGQFAASNKAIELIGKELGMFVERKEQGAPGDFAALDSQELGRQLYDEYVALGISPAKARTLVAIAAGDAASGDAGEGGGKPN